MTPNCDECCQCDHAGFCFDHEPEGPFTLAGLLFVLSLAVATTAVILSPLFLAIYFGAVDA